MFIVSIYSSLAVIHTHTLLYSLLFHPIFESMSTILFHLCQPRRQPSPSQKADLLSFVVILWSMAYKFVATETSNPGLMSLCCTEGTVDRTIFSFVSGQDPSLSDDEVNARILPCRRVKRYTSAPVSLLSLSALPMSDLARLR